MLSEFGRKKNETQLAFSETENISVDFGGRIAYSFWFIVVVFVLFFTEAISILNEVKIVYFHSNTNFNGNTWCEEKQAILFVVDFIVLDAVVGVVASIVLANKFEIDTINGFLAAWASKRARSISIRA